MKFIKYILPLLLISTYTYAQNIKRDVVVIGATAAGTAAAIQAARSGVKSTLLDLNSSIGKDITAADTINSWGVLKELKNKKIAPGIQLKSLTDTVKNLTVISNVAIKKIEESGKGWEIKLKDGRDLKCLVIVDGANHTALIEDKPGDIEKRLITPGNVYSSRQFRAAAASGNNPADVFTLGSLISVTENYVFASPADRGNGSMYTGQTAGAIAAYAAFFKTNTRNLNVRMTQGELLRYNGRLLPIEDIAATDSNLISIQHVAATGILKANYGKFNPDSTINSEELRLPLKEYYSRSQIWFADHKVAKMTIDDAISLMMFTATRGNELKKEIEQGWKTSFKFTTEFDPARPITRRELAVLLDNFLQPFNVRVDFQGNLLS
jgi:hypothetical protein